MKKKFKSLLIITMIFLFVVTLTGCGKEETNEGTKGNDQVQKTTEGTKENDQGQKTTEGTKISDINVSNWEKVVKENYGLDISLPSGWTVKKAESFNNYSNVDIIFVPNEETTYEDFGETIFSKSKEVSTKQAPSVESFQASLKVAGTSTWRYYPDIKNERGQSIVYVQVDYSNVKGNVELLINR